MKSYKPIIRNIGYAITSVVVSLGSTGCFEGLADATECIPNTLEAIGKGLENFSENPPVVVGMIGGIDTDPQVLDQRRQGNPIPMQEIFW